MSNENGLYEHALVAALYAVRASGGNLEAFYENVAAGIIVNSIRPLPQDQERVLKLVKQAISDITA